MTEQYHTLIQLEDLFQSLIVSMLDWDQTDPSKENDVRIAWPTDGMPAWEITDDIIFLKCVEVDSNYNRARENIDIDMISPADFAREVSYTRVVQLGIVAYGPNSYENTVLLRDQIFDPENQLTLSKEKIYLVHDTPSPDRAPEKFEGRWWERTDINFTFNELVVRSLTVPAIESVNIEIHSNVDFEQIDELNIE